MIRWGLVACAIIATGACAAKPKPAPEAKPLETVLTLAASCAVPFRDNAVLQQQMPLPVWGTSLPGAKVTVTFDGQDKTATADKQGRWRVVLETMDAVKLKSVNDCPAGKTMTIVCAKDGEEAVSAITNLVMGDVWLCAGQSNMAGRMKRAGHPKNYPTNSVVTAHYPALRRLDVSENKWQICSPETAVHISRVAFFFARRVQREALVPMGLMVTAVGGSNIESWLNQPPYATGGNYTRLLSPLVGYGIRGAIWYQGESNEKDGRGYQPKLESLITGWRKVWKQPPSSDSGVPGADFPVHFVQLPGIGQSTLEYPAGGDGRAEIRQAYFETLALKNTGMAVTIDIGAPGEHPPNKYDTGVRLARSVLQKEYGFKDITACPLYTGHKIKGNTIRVSFDNAQNGLMIAKKEGFLPPTPTPDAKLQWLAIQAKDGTWHWADGKIDGSELVVSSKDVKEPIAARYAYTRHPCGNLLYNKDGQPVGPFSTNGYGTKE
jgi:sialate O-acetylesterase